MSLPAADFSKFCWNRICLILAGTVRQGDGSFLPSFCHPATDFLSGWKRADPAPRWKKPDWTAASSGADLKIDSFFELLGLRPVHRRRKPVKRSFSHPCDGAADLISRIFPDHVVPWADPPGAKLCMTNCRVSYCACISGGRMENSCSGVSPEPDRPRRLARKREIISMVSCSALFAYGRTALSISSTDGFGDSREHTLIIPSSFSRKNSMVCIISLARMNMERDRCRLISR